MTLALHQITKTFGATRALDSVDLTVAQAEVHALIGENGAGKSTLMNILSGLHRPDAGTMHFVNAPYAPKGPADARRRGIAHIHQELALCPHLPVAENIFLGIEPPRPQLFARASALLREFGRDIDPRRRTRDLSLADQQVVEICRALAADARVILMDEPTSSLQRADVDRLFRLIHQLRARGIAIIYISHFLEEVREIADRYTVLRDGKTVATGTIRDVTDAQLITHMVGRELALAEHPPTTPNPQPQTALQVTLPNATFTLNRGEVLGIAGLIGSGRTELVRAIFGLTATTGTITLHGRGIGYLSEDRKGEGLALQLPIADNVTLSRFDTCARGGWIDRVRQDRQTADVIQRLRIKAAGPRARVARLSGGNQQKVALGRLLHQDPDVLLLDEPTRGIDIGSKADVAREIAALAAAGKAILVVSSYLPELFAMCDRIAVMTRGVLSPARPVSEWTPESVMQTAIGSAA
jgi:ribose transport system ATP-binding protein